jgi:hypothetical protein
MAELLAKKKETKLLLSITNGRLGYLEINEDKMRFKDAMKGEKAIGGNEGMTHVVEAEVVELTGCLSVLQDYLDNCKHHLEALGIPLLL